MSTERRRPDAVPSTHLVVELCGLPGAGKTTIARSLAAQLRSEGVATALADAQVSASAPLVTRLWHKTLSAAAVLLSDPWAECRDARALASAQSNVRDRIALPVLWWARKRVIAQSATSAGASIVEEGLVQALWSAGLRSPGTPASTLVKLAETAVRPDVVVHVDVPHRLAADRLASRTSKHSRVQHLAPDDQLAALRRGRLLLDEILREWSSRDLSHVLVVDGTTADCAATLAADLLPRQLDPPGPG